jgi:hypothetical protein
MVSVVQVVLEFLEIMTMRMPILMILTTNFRLSIMIMMNPIRKMFLVTR